MRKGKAGKRITPMVMILGVIGAGAIVAFAQGAKKSYIPSKVQVNTDRAASPAVTMVAAADRKPLSYYTGQVRSDLFTSALPTLAPKTIPAPPKITLPAVKPEIVDPLADYTYSGTVSVDNQQLALIENSKTRTGEYYKVGDSWMGGKIESIDDRTVVLDVAGKKQRLAKSDNYQLTPLDKSAAFLQPNAQGQPGTMVGPNGQPMPGAAPDPNNPNGAAMMFPGGRGGMRGNWQNMTPEQQQQLRDRFMNRQFNGGGRGGGGGFGGGGFGGGGRRNRGGGGFGFGFGGG